MKLKQCNIKGFFTYDFSYLLFLHDEEKVVLTVCTADFQVIVSAQRAEKFLATKKFVLATKP